MAVNKVDFGGETLIDLTNDTVKPNTLLQGYTAHAANGEAIVGTYVASGEGGEAIQEVVYVDCQVNTLTMSITEISLTHQEIKNHFLDDKYLILRGISTDMTEIMYIPLKTYSLAKDVFVFNGTSYVYMEGVGEVILSLSVFLLEGNYTRTLVKVVSTTDLG